MKKLYSCHFEEWSQWLTRSSNYRSSLTVNTLAFGTGGCRWRLDCITVCDNFFSGNSLTMKHAWMGTSLFWLREGVDLY